MRPYHRQDYYLAVTTFVLVVFGLIMVASASVVESYTATGSNNYYFIRQSIFAVIGIFLWWFLQKLDYRYWKRWATTLMIIAGVLLIAVLIPGIGVESGGARRWIGFGDFTLQASEVAKFAIVVYLAYWFERKGRAITGLYQTFLPFVLVLLGVFFLVMQEPDLGTATVIALIAGTMYLVAGASWGQLATLFTAGVLGVLFLIKLAPYRLRRLLTFLNPGADPLGAGYHINQALLAIGSGGIFGLGYGYSRQKYNFLPEPSSDSIFAIIGEELGLIGAVCLVVVPFAIIVWRGLLVARKAPDMFGRMMALGLTSWIVGLFPLTGVPLPFISLGGSSLVITLAAAGVLLNISKQTVKSSEDENPLSWWWNWWARYANPGGRRRVG